MKKIWLLTTLLIGSLLIAWCSWNKWEIHEQEELIWWFSKNPKIEKIINQQKENQQQEWKIPERFRETNFENLDIRSINLQELTPEEKVYLMENIDFEKLSPDDKEYIMAWHDPYDYVENNWYYIITSHLVNDKCTYDNGDLGIKINLSEWGKCKILYQEIEDLSWNITLRRLTIRALPINDKWWFEWFSQLWRINIVPNNERVDEHWMDSYNNFLWTEIWGNKKYNFYVDVWSASPSYYYTYYPISYEDFICKNMQKLENGNMIDINGNYCYERDKDWESLWINMPNPMLWVYQVANDKLKKFIQLYD